MNEKIGKTPKQYNEITGNVYGGKNQAELTLAKIKNGYKSNSWLTFNQARQSGRQILKGSKAVSIFKGYGRVTKKDEEDGKIKTVSFSNAFLFVISVIGFIIFSLLFYFFRSVAISKSNILMQCKEKNKSLILLLFFS